MESKAIGFLAVALLAADMGAAASHTSLRQYADTYTDYHFVAETPLTDPQGLSQSLCVVYERSNLANGYTVKGYALSSNRCRPVTRLLGLLHYPDPSIVTLSMADVTRMQVRGELPEDLSGSPGLSLKARIRANFVLYMTGAFVALILTGAIWASWRERRNRRQPSARQKLTFQAARQVAHQREDETRP
ncbi:hypothetical protein [Pseudoponticoccus marisrubri]|uniref:hypothetical protein n=1 Tax=Pseudoponticoccus marisrubri TaxID=1685382 RepID=UPI0012FD2E6F|nr:hypothetical protein [Pseudoponticoccus marisrubri]